MQNSYIQQAQYEFSNELKALKENGIDLNEKQKAILFTKSLIRQTRGNVTFCNDNEFFASKTPTGYDVVGFYFDQQWQKTPFSITVCEQNGLWYPSKRYVAADTKSCSGSVLLWILLSLGCTLMGILMYFIISAAVGI